jgi:hypothetical protein
MKTGISNRKSADREAHERREHPPINPDAPPRREVSSTTSDGPLPDEAPQTSRKSGSRSTAQKTAGVRHPDGPAPPAKKVGPVHPDR